MEKKVAWCGCVVAGEGEKVVEEVFKTRATFGGDRGPTRWGHAPSRWRFWRLALALGFCDVFVQPVCRRPLEHSAEPAGRALERAPLWHNFSGRTVLYASPGGPRSVGFETGGYPLTTRWTRML